VLVPELAAATCAGATHKGDFIGVGVGMGVDVAVGVGIAGGRVGGTGGGVVVAVGFGVAVGVESTTVTVMLAPGPVQAYLGGPSTQAPRHSA